MRAERLGMSAAEEVRQLEKLRAWGTAPVPVPPYDETQRERSVLTLGNSIREGQRQRQSIRVRRHVTRTLGGLAALAALALLGLWIPGADQTEEAVTHAQGSVAERPSEFKDLTRIEAHVFGTGTFSEPGRDPKPVTTLSAIRPGGRVQAGPHGAEVSTDTTKVVIDPKAIVTLAELTPLAEEWTIETGEARFSVNPERHKHVTVVTGDTRVEVVGTEFAVATETSDEGTGLAKSISTTVTVQKGRVTVRHSGQVYTLNPGDRWENDARPSPSTRGAALGRSAAVGHAARAGTKSSFGKKALDPGTTLAQENRLFHEALILRNAGHRTEALRAFAGFIARFPRSTLRADAEHELERLRLGNQ